MKKPWRSPLPLAIFRVLGVLSAITAAIFAPLYVGIYAMFGEVYTPKISGHDSQIWEEVIFMVYSVTARTPFDAKWRKTSRSIKNIRCPGAESKGYRIFSRCFLRKHVVLPATVSIHICSASTFFCFSREKWEPNSRLDGNEPSKLDGRRQLRLPSASTVCSPLLAPSYVLRFSSLIGFPVRSPLP